jgi:hypothetical protein
MNLAFNNWKQTLTASLIVVATGVWYLLDSGFCFSQMRYVSDKEHIVQAIRYNMTDMGIDGANESIEAFLKKNPTCCSVNRHPSSRNFLDVCFGFNVSEVTLNYEERARNRSIEPFRQVDISVSACGEALKQKRGMNYSTLQKTY